MEVEQLALDEQTDPPFVLLNEFDFDRSECRTNVHIPLACKDHPKPRVVTRRKQVGLRVGLQTCSLQMLH